MNSEERSNEADLRAMLDRFPPGEWFTASNSADEDNPWWIFAFDKWDDEDDSKTYPIGAVHCERGEFTAESELAEFIAAARNAIPSLIAERDAALARIAAVEAQLAEVNRVLLQGGQTVEVRWRAAVAVLAASPTPTGPEPATKPKWVRDPGCVERWPECYDGDYNPACCRFPKSCSCLIPATPEPTEETPPRCEHGEAGTHVYGKVVSAQDAHWRPHFCPGPGGADPKETPGV